MSNSTVPVRYRRVLRGVMGIAALSWIFGAAVTYSVSERRPKQPFKEMELFTRVAKIIEEQYVEPVDQQQLMYGAVRGMLQSLDSHSMFMSPDEYAEMKQDTSGQFGGLGIEISLRDGVLTVISPIEDTPAYRAGVKSGDRIIKIDDQLTESMNIFQAVKLMKGKPGTSVRLTISREEGTGKERQIKQLELTLVRDLIKVKSVKQDWIADKYLYLGIKSFQRETARELRAAIEKSTKREGFAGIILDLRNNPGGLLEEAVEVSDLFIDSGVVVSTVRRDPTLTQIKRASKGDTVYRGPMVVLVNEGSASASEIVSGALQDNNRALVMGEQTFGKGSVQHVIDLDDGSGMKLTVAKFILPGGRAIQEIGVVPDVAIPQRRRDEKTKELVDLPTSPVGIIRERDLPRHLIGSDQKNKKEYDIKPLVDTFQLVRMGPDRKVKDREFDYQLTRAVDYLESWMELSRTFECNKKSVKIRPGVCSIVEVAQDGPTTKSAL